MTAELLNENAVFRAKNALKESPVIALRELSVTQEESASQIEIRGHVKSFYHKQLAQEVVRSVCDDQRVRNHVQVDFN